MRRGVALLAGMLALATAAQPGAVFLMIIPDARTTALGGCGTASSDIGPNTYYNPAVLGFGPGVGATWSHVNWLTGFYPRMAYEYAAVSNRLLPDLNFGANCTYLTTGETDVINERGEFLGRYRTWDLAVGVAAGWRALPNLAAGASFKYIHSVLVPDWVWEVMPELGRQHGGVGGSVAVGAGMQYRPWRWCGLGLAVNNLGPGIDYSNGEGDPDPLPTIVRFGWEAKPDLPVPVEIRFVGDVWRDVVTDFRVSEYLPVVSFIEQFEIGIGLELRLLEVASVRVGYFEDIQGQRGGIWAVPDPGIEWPVHISIARWLADPGRWSNEEVRLSWGVGVEYEGFRFDVGVDEEIYAFPTRNVRFQVSWGIR